MKLRVLSYNILKGGVGREGALGDVIAACAPDLVVLQEAYQPSVVRHLADTCGMPNWASSAGHSVAFMSRVEIAGHVWRRVRWAKRAYLEIVTGSGLCIYGVHLSAVHSNLTEQRRAYELRALLRSVERHQHGTHLVTGDFNTLAPGERLDMNKLPPRLRALAWVTGKSIRWITIRMMLEAGYVDGYRKFHGDEGHTFTTWDPHVRLDYAFLPEPSKGNLLRCEVVRDHPALGQASDHFPLLTEIQG
ncbi:MAG TPA: endonuclease/exonuclease/phosphatase family protein [Vicinamibacterales bacterium]|nr:endonuclease/exonuclease/phosphatase family protein [Vicinamibacterales bacterium]